MISSDSSDRSAIPSVSSSVGALTPLIEASVSDSGTHQGRMNGARRAPEEREVETISRDARESRFQKALFAYHRGDYSQALREFERVIKHSEKTGQFSRTLETYSYLLRILAEREDFLQMERVESRVIEILSLSRSGAAEISSLLKSRALYVLGICSCYRGSRYDQAMTLFHESIDWALASGKKESLASPLYGAATGLYAQKRYVEALRELDRLDILLSCLDLPDLVSASNLLRSMIKRNQGVLDEALESAWRAFDTLKHHPHLVLYLHTLCVLGTIFSQNGDDVSARLYLDLADRSLKREEFPRIARLVDEAVNSIDRELGRSIGADLIFDAKTGVLIEKNVGEIHFEGQFILRDLLRVFLEEPGRIFSKDELVKRVWHEAYSPKIHDNKIYVTIKRLRKLLEPEIAQREPRPDYILRAKNGYFLSPKVRVLIHDSSAGKTAKKTQEERR